MNNINKQIIVAHLKKWWTGYMFAFALSFSMVKSVSNTLGASEEFFTICFWTGIFIAVYVYSFKRVNTGIWKLLRILGYIALAASCLGMWLSLNGKAITEIPDLSTTDQDVMTAQRYLWGVFASLLLIGIGELLLYLNKINHKLKKMTCPACYGKGYIDKDDLKRLEAHREVQPGVCGYCTANGHVDQGYTAKVDLKHFLCDLHSTQRYEAKKKAIQGTGEIFETL